LLFLEKAGASECRFVQVEDLDEWRNKGKGSEGKISAKTLTSAEWNFSFGVKAELFDKLSKWPDKLANIADRIAQGIRTSANEVYVLDLVREGKTIITAHSKILAKDVKLERRAVFLFLQGREIKSYRVLPAGKVVIVPYVIQNRQAKLMSEDEIRTCFPLLYSYLIENKNYLGDREKCRFRGSEWFAFGRQQNIDLMLLPKILVPDTADRASFALDEDGCYSFTSGYGITLLSGVKESPKYILGLLNSSLLNFYAKRISTVINKYGFFRYFAQFLEQLPIRRIDFSMPADKAQHDNVVAQVDQIISLYKRILDAKTPHDKEVLERHIQTVTSQIDEGVYYLYGVNSVDILHVS
jgi:hypothetical protein